SAVSSIAWQVPAFAIGSRPALQESAVFVGCQPDRLVAGVIPVGGLQPREGCDEVACGLESQRHAAGIREHHRRESCRSAWCESIRFPAWQYRGLRQGLRRLQLVQAADRQGDFLRYPVASELDLPDRRTPYVHTWQRSDLRSDHPTQQQTRVETGGTTVTADRLPGPRDRQALRLSDQSLQTRGAYYR